MARPADAIRPYKGTVKLCVFVGEAISFPLRRNGNSAGNNPAAGCGGNFPGGVIRTVREKQPKSLYVLGKEETNGSDPQLR